MNKNKIFLNSFYPLIWTKQGREAVQKYNIPSFVDGSCRREPDFESEYPSITSLCRFKKLVPRINEQNIIVYITNKNYFGQIEKHWRLVSVLKAIIWFKNHSDAANWYKSNRIKVPSNCMIPQNPPLSKDKTIGKNVSLCNWDSEYKFRAKKCGKFVICKSLYTELNNPNIITGNIMKEVFGKIVQTRNPPYISETEFKNLLTLCNVKIKYM